MLATKQRTNLVIEQVTSTKTSSPWFSLLGFGLGAMGLLALSSTATTQEDPPTEKYLGLTREEFYFQQMKMAAQLSSEVNTHLFKLQNICAVVYNTEVYELELEVFQYLTRRTQSNTVSTDHIKNDLNLIYKQYSIVLKENQ